MQRLPACLTLRGALLRREGEIMGGHRHGDRPIGQRHGLLMHGLIDGVEDVTMRDEHLVQRFPEILQQMQAIRDLSRSGSPLAGALGIGAGPIPGDHLPSRMRSEPLRHRLGRAFREQRHGLVALQVYQDRAIGVPFTQGEIVHPQHGGGGESRPREPAQHAQQGIAADHHVPLVAEVHPGLPTQGHAEGGDQALGQPQRAPGPGGDELRQPFGEDAARTAAIGAEKLPHAELEYDTDGGPWEIGESAPVVTVDAPGGKPADRTVYQGLRRGDAHSQLGCGLVEMPRLKMQRGATREQT
jgi:hypothetical protein